MFRSIVRVFAFIAFHLAASCSVEVVRVGDGAGVVTSTPAGISCGSEHGRCRADFGSASEVKLVAAPAAGSRFVGWGGECSGTNATCRLNLSGWHLAFTRRVSVLFERLDSVNDPVACGTDHALSSCLQPSATPEYYIDQGELYFHTMATHPSKPGNPNYSDLVARWEWPPWLLLTGFGRANLIWTDELLALFPTAYASMDCRYFDVQPFSRCHVVFDYSGELCPIYEEFTFNEQGEMTFIEAWSDYAGLLPMTDPNDTWAEGDAVHRLSTKLPGLGNETGRIDLDSPWMEEAAIRDADVADFLRRARQPYLAYFTELFSHIDDLSNGCRPPTE